MNNLAVLLHAQGKLAEAEPLLRWALEAWNRTLGADHADTLSSVNNLAMLLQDQCKLAEAEPLCRRALEARERTLGADHANTLESVNDLALLLQIQGRLAEAEPLFRQVLEALERALGADHADTVNSDAKEPRVRTRRAGVGDESSNVAQVAPALTCRGPFLDQSVTQEVFRGSQWNDNALVAYLWA
jgi:tetratricopeptide (TPR) repeat protein